MSVALTTQDRPDLSKPFEMESAESAESASVALTRAEGLRGYAIDLERQIHSLRQERVSALGEGEAFVRRDENGELRALKAGIPLKASEGHIYSIDQKGKDADGNWVVLGRDWRITAAGYQFINTVAGIQVVTPPRIEVEGKSVPNPYVLRHEDERRRSALREVHVRSIAFGRAATGNLVMADSYLIWRPISYLTTSIVALVGKSSWDKDARGRRINSGTIDDVKMLMESEFHAGREKGEFRGWAFWPIEEAGDDMVGVAARVSLPEVVKQIQAHSERQKFGDRIARTICERIALKKLIGAAKVNPREYFEGNRLVDAVAVVPIFAWAEPDSLLFKNGGVGKLLERAKSAENPVEVDALLEAARGAAKAQGVQVEVIEARHVSGDPEDDYDPTMDEREAAEHREMSEAREFETEARETAADRGGDLFAGEER